MDAQFSFTTLEPQLYDKWQKAGVFNPDNIEESSKNESFSIIMPPPNANDPLHIGHAMFVALEDILIRYHRMKGDDTVWIPGTDHAGIETQYVFEKKLQKQNKSRFNFDRETLYKMIWEYVQENSSVAVDQIKKLGASADWSRYKFTLDDDVVEFVLSTFFSLYEKGLIYRDLQLVNYCTKCGTSYSELEVQHKEQIDPLYYIKYGPFTLATVRPETKFGDTAVAVHPDDERYTDFVGKTIEVEGLNGTFSLKVIADEYVDPEFGTGVVKITPAHDPNDFEVGKRHNLEIKQVIDTNGKLTKETGPYAGLSVVNARKKVVEDLTKKGLIEKVNEKYSHTVGTCYRCGRVLEPLPLPQFFISVNKEGASLTRKALAALDSKETQVHGAGREKILRHWLENLKDWNISRQIVWGIRIPVWYNVAQCEQDMTLSFVSKDGIYTQGILADLLKQYSIEEIEAGLQQTFAGKSLPFSVSIEKPQEAGVWLPETDTFDTWFSSAQWPVVTLKTNKEQDFERFYPTTVMETGYDILPFWVMRMMLLSIYLTGKSPFTHVYLHGLVRDEKGQKMSKSKGNVINPLAIVDEFGADALRMALVIRSTPGQDKSVGRQDFKAMRNFGNKIWNATRYVVTVSQENSQKNTLDSQNDKDFIDTLQNTTNEITTLLEEYKIGLAADTVYSEFWHWYCDTCIEDHKNGTLSSESLIHGLEVFLKLLHPFMPYVTEACWQELQGVQQKQPENSLLITAPWPN